MKELLEKAKNAKIKAALLSESEKNAALENMAQALIDCKGEILSANEADMLAARGRISDVMLDRLRLDESRIAGMAKGIRDCIPLADPVGKILDSHVSDGGLKIAKVSVPIGVIAIIYESRPNVTSDAAALCLKSGNVCILRGGKEAFNSAKAIVSALKAGLKKTGLSEDLINLVEDTTRESAKELMTANGYVDLLIPRGGKGLISSCIENATVPIIATGTGICHIFVERTADLDMAVKIVENAKTSRPSVCNAEEVLLVDRGIAKEFLPVLKSALVDKRIKKGLVPVELRLDEESAKIIPGTPAGENDFDTEFLDYILAVKVVSSTAEAAEHISKHSTAHSDGIVTRDESQADLFCRLVDSAAVYVNASTRFTDGGEFGLGCEMGISTQKLHARGPMGLKELTSYKYIIRGNGNIR